MRKILKQTVFVFLLVGGPVLAGTTGAEKVHQAAFVMEPTPTDTVMQVGGNAGKDLASSRYGESNGTPLGGTSNSWGDEEMDLIILKKKVEQQMQTPAAYPFPTGKNALAGQGKFVTSTVQTQSETFPAGNMTATSETIQTSKMTATSENLPADKKITTSKTTTTTTTTTTTANANSKDAAAVPSTPKKAMNLVDSMVYTNEKTAEAEKASLRATTEAFPYVKPIVKDGKVQETTQTTRFREEQLADGAIFENADVVINGVSALKKAPEKNSIANATSAEVGFYKEEEVALMEQKTPVDTALDAALDGDKAPQKEEKTVAQKAGVRGVGTTNIAQKASVTATEKQKIAKASGITVTETGRVGEPTLTLASAEKTLPTQERKVTVVSEVSKSAGNTDSAPVKVASTAQSNPVPDVEIPLEIVPVETVPVETVEAVEVVPAVTPAVTFTKEPVEEPTQSGILGQVKAETARALTTEDAAQKALGVREDALSVSQKESDLDKSVQGVIVVEKPSSVLTDGAIADTLDIPMGTENETPDPTSLVAVDTLLVCPSSGSSGRQTKVYPTADEVILAAKDGNLKETTLKIPADCALEKRGDETQNVATTDAPGTVAVKTHLVCPAAQVEGSNIKIYPARADVVMAARQGKLSERTTEIPVGCTLEEGFGAQVVVKAAASAKPTTSADTKTAKADTKAPKKTTEDKKDPIKLIPATEDPILAGVPTANTKASGAFVGSDSKSLDVFEVQSKPTQTTQAEAPTGMQRLRLGESVQDWEARPGDTLRGLLTRWGEQSGWTVIWSLERDYHLEAGVVFRGRFVDVAGAIVRVFARATPAPIGTFYQGNRVLVINAQEEENGY